MKIERILLGGIALAVSFFVWSSPGENENPSRKFMRQKLIYAQGILEGATLANYDLIQTNAGLLRNMNLTNAFFILQNPDYFQRISKFQTSVDTLIASAKTHDLEKTTEAYAAMTRNCIACHQTFRREQHLRSEILNTNK